MKEIKKYGICTWHNNRCYNRVSNTLLSLKNKNKEDVRNDSI